MTSDPSSPPPDDQTGPPAPIRAALARLLGPLTRTAIQFGLTLPNLLPLLKQAYVEQAERHFALSGKGMNDSRVTLLTGVHRKDVAALRHRPEEAPRQAPTPLAQLVSRWSGDPAWRAADGAPLPLPRTGAAPSFDSLAESISKDVRPRALLDELLRTGLVREAADGMLILAGRADIPTGDLERLAHYYGRNLADHLAAAGHNLAAPPGAPRFPERALAYDQLSDAAIATLSETAARLGMDMLTQLNEQAIALAASDPPAPGAARRLLAGVYVFAAPDETPEDAQ